MRCGGKKRSQRNSGAAGHQGEAERKPWQGREEGKKMFTVYSSRSLAGINKPRRTKSLYHDTVGTTFISVLFF